MPALGCLLALSSCGGDDAGDASASSSTTSTSESSTTTEDSTTTSSTGSTTTTAPVPVEPADGGDVGACADGSCEVEVTVPIELSFDPALNVGTVTLSADDPEYLGIRVVNPGTVASVSARVGGSATMGLVSLRIVSLEEQTARLIFAPCGEAEGCRPGLVSSRG